MKMKKKTLIQIAAIMTLIQFTAAYTIYSENIQNIGSITGTGDFNTTGRVCDGTQCLDSLDIPGQPNIDWSNITTGTNPLASDVSNLWTNATAQQAAIAALNATALANMGTYLNYTSSCAAGEVYEWGTGCITTPTGGSGSENATNLISDNPILIKPSGDTDDYLSLSTVSNNNYITTIGSSDIMFKSDYNLSTYFQLNFGSYDMDSYWISADGKYLQVVKRNGGDAEFNTNGDSISLKPSGDTDDYLSFYTLNNEQYIKSVGNSGKIYLESDGVSSTNVFVYGGYDSDSHASLSLAKNQNISKYVRIGYNNGLNGMYIYATGTEDKIFFPVAGNQYDLGTSAYRWKNGYIVNAWTVGDLVFNYGAVNGSGGTNYRIIEAEKLTNDRLKGLMYVMDGKAVMWIEPDGKLHTTQEIDTKWDGITGLSFDNDGGVYKDNEIVRYPVVGSGNETYLSPVFIEDGKKEFNGDDKIAVVKSKPIKELKTTTTTLISIEEGGEEGLDGLSSGTTA